MYCQSCGAEIPDNTKFCGECGAKVISADEPSSLSYPAGQGYEVPYDVPMPGRPAKKKKRWIIPVVIICAAILGLIIALLVLRGQTVVYKYESVSVDAGALGGDDLGGYLGGALAETVLDSMLQELYVEIGFDKTITIFSQDLGYYTTKLDELNTNIDAEAVEYTVDTEFISLEANGVYVMLRRVTDKGELALYKHLLEAAVANGEEMDLSGLLA